jgi:hypothetical protein
MEALLADLRSHRALLIALNEIPLDTLSTRHLQLRKRAPSTEALALSYAPTSSANKLTLQANNGSEPLPQSVIEIT